MFEIKLRYTSGYVRSSGVASLPNYGLSATNFGGQVAYYASQTLKVCGYIRHNSLFGYVHQQFTARHNPSSSKIAFDETFWRFYAEPDEYAEIIEENFHISYESG